MQSTQTMEAVTPLRRPPAHTLSLAPGATAPARPASDEAAWRLTQVLQTTLELRALLELFARELAAVLTHDGLSYRCRERSLEVNLGRRARHRCTYRLVIGKEALGELTLYRRRRFAPGELVRLENLLCALVYPLRNALTYLEALRAAHKDPLTGVNNRSTFGPTLDREVELAHRHDTPFSLLVMDLDRFKAINDRYGHAVGDQALRAVAAAITRVVRRTDMLFRYGGEEFVLLLSNTAESGALLLAERIRRAVARRPLEVDGLRLPVTVSIGVASLRPGEDGPALFARADQAVYAAKAGGRNRVCPAG